MAPPPVAVDITSVRDLAQRARMLADQLAEREQLLRGAAPPGDGVLGDAGAAQAYRLFHDAWSAELHVLGNAIRQLADGLDQAAGGYDMSDGRGSRRFN